MTILFRLVVMALLAVYFAIGAWLYVGQDDQIFPRTVNTIANPMDNAPEGTQLVSLHTPDGATLNGILFNAQQTSPTLVIAFGGNAHDVTGMARFLRDSVFNDGTFAVVGLSYRGYPNAIGKPSTGQPSQRALMQDALLIYDTMVAQRQPAKVVVVGYSLGTALATHVAAQRPVHAVILAAPFASLVDIAQRHYTLFPAAWMVNHPFRTEDELPAVRSRITIVASEKDGLIPTYHPTRLLKANPFASLVMLTPAPLHGDVLNHPSIPDIFRKAAE